MQLGVHAMVNQLVNWKSFRVLQHTVREGRHLVQILASSRAAPMKEPREATKRSAAR